MIGADLSPKWSLAIAMGLLIVLLGAPGIAQSPSGSGYLAGREPDTVSILPQAPGVGSARDTADRDIFRSTRALKTNAPERWALARRDADVTIPDLLADFSCALDIQLDAASAPAPDRSAAQAASGHGRDLQRPEGSLQAPSALSP